MAHLCFICHSSQNFSTASKIVEELEKNGIDCWIAPRNIPPGASYSASIVQGIKRAEFLIFIFTADSNKSDAVINEIEQAQHLKIPVIPFKLENIPYSDSLQYYLPSRQAINAFNQPLHTAIDELIGHIHSTSPLGSDDKKPIDNGGERNNKKNSNVKIIAAGIVVAIVLAFAIMKATKRSQGGPSNQTVKKENTETQAEANNKLTPATTCEPEKVDFTSGKNIVYSADFSVFSKQQNQYGTVQPSANWNLYEMEALSNTWVGLPSYIKLSTALENNFIYDIWFKIIEGNPSVNVILSDDGVNYSNYQFYLDVSQDATSTYTAEEGWIKDNFYASVKKQFAERAIVSNCVTSKINWKEINHITVKRDGETIYYYLNNYLLQSFQAAVFPIKKTTFSLAQKSKIQITSIEGSIPR
ncbi:MAG: toll/interleukin-1 receptor domain-containing protein [Agriterribacter sp.]